MTCAASVLTLCAGNVYAAAASGKAADNASGNTVGEIVVTAEKRDSTLQKAAVAISAYTSDKRDQIGINSVQDMTNFTPGFVYNTGNDRVTLRGIGRYTNQLSADSSVGVYEDGAFETFTVKAGNDTIFVDRIEVLRGPQGTLYGRASIGGAVNIISRKPTKEWYGEVRANIDNYGAHVEEGAVSGPINDNMQFRISASKTDQAKGYYKNLDGGPSQGQVRDEWYLESQLQGQFGPKFDFWLKAFGGEWNDLGGQAGGKITNQRIVGADGVTPVANPSYALLTGNGGGGEFTDALVPALGGYAAPGVTNLVTNNPSGLNPGNSNMFNIYSNIPQQVKLHAYYGGVLKLNYHGDGFDVKYIGQVQHYAYFTREEWGEGNQLATGVVSYTDPKGNTIFPNSELYYGENHFFTTHEINIISTTASKFQWVVGAYNFNEQYYQPESIAMPGQANLGTVYPLSTPCIYYALGYNPTAGGCTAAAPNPNHYVYDTAANMGAETFAGFAQSDWQATSTLKLTTGVRYSFDAKYGNDSARVILLGPLFGLGNLAFQNPYSAKQTAAQPGASAAVLDPTTGIYTRKLGASWGGVTATAGLQWQPDAYTNAYAKYSRGSKAGGFNSGSGLSLNVEQHPETSNDYQLGFKHNFFRTLQFNLDLFYDQYYNAQIPIGVANGNLVSTAIYNIPEAKSDGVEVEATWQPTRALQMIASYGYDNTEILNSGCVINAVGDPSATGSGAKPDATCAPQTAGVPQNLRGNPLPNAPKNKLALNANYTFFFEPGSLSLSATYAWRDAQYGSIFATSYNRAPSWDQVDLRAEWKSANGHYSVIAYGKNVFDKLGYQAGRVGTLQPGATAASNVYIIQDVLNPPALYGLEVQYRF